MHAGSRRLPSLGAAVLLASAVATALSQISSSPLSLLPPFLLALTTTAALTFFEIAARRARLLRFSAAAGLTIAFTLVLPMGGLGLAAFQLATLPSWTLPLLLALLVAEAAAFWMLRGIVTRSLHLQSHALGICVDAFLINALLVLLHLQADTLIAIKPGTEAIHVLFLVTSAALSPACLLLCNSRLLYGAARKAAIGAGLICGIALLLVDSRMLVGLYPAVHRVLWLLGVALVFRTFADALELGVKSFPPAVATPLLTVAFLGTACVIGPLGLIGLATSADLRLLMTRSTAGSAALDLIPQSWLTQTESSDSFVPTATTTQDLSKFNDLIGKFNILLISIDGLRADFVHPQRAAFLARLAMENSYFPIAYSQGSKTSIGVSCLLTGRYSSHLDWTDEDSTGLHYRGIPVFPEGSLLHEQAKIRGYQALATLEGNGHEYLSKSSGFARGFDQFREMDDVKSANDPSQQAAVRAIEQRRAATGSRFYQWVHLFDPHRSFVPRRYEQLVARSDRAVHKMIEALVVDHLWDTTVVIVTSDHGRSLGRNGIYGHSGSLSEEQTRVPLIVHVPGITQRIVSDPVAGIDVARTILFLVGATDPATPLDGINLLPLMIGEPAPARTLFSELHNYLPTAESRPKKLRAAIAYPLKLIVNLENQTYERYNLQQDPLEEQPLADSPAFARLAAELAHLAKQEVK